MLKKPLMIVSSAAIALSILASPYSINFKVSEQETSAAQVIKSKKSLAFYGSDSSTQVLNKVEKNVTDGSLNKINQKIKNKQIKTNAKKEKDILNDDVRSYTDVAYDVKKVRNNPKLQKRLQEILQSGKKVYLYGGLTLEEYKKLLNIKEMTVDVTDAKSDKQIIAQFGETEEKPRKKNSHAEKDEDVREVIGYTLDSKDASKVFISDITIESPMGTVKPTEEHFVREVLSGVNATINKEEGNVQEEAEVGGILHTNKASAGNVTRKSSATLTASAYNGSYLLGRVYTDWTLMQDTDESEYKYDYFVVKDKSQLYSYNSARTNYLYVDHDIPGVEDQVADWAPVDDTASPYQISIGLPWSISTSFNMGSNPKVDSQGSIASDYGRWVVTDYNIGDGEVFYPYTGWKSTGTYANMDIRKKAQFYANEYMGAGLNVHYNVTYDYTKRQQ